MQAKGKFMLSLRRGTGKYFTSDFFTAWKKLFKKLKVSTWSVDKKV